MKRYFPYLLSLSFTFLFLFVDVKGQNIVHYDVSTWIAPEANPEVFCSASKELIKIVISKPVYKSIQYKYNYNDCSNNGYVLGDCPVLEWTGPNIVERHNEIDPISLDPSIPYSYCKSWILVRPTESASYSVRWIQDIKQDPTACGPSSFYQNKFEGTNTLKIYQTPPTPILTAQTVADSTRGDLLYLTAHGSLSATHEWDLSGQISEVASPFIVNTLNSPYDCKDYKVRDYILGAGRCYSDYSNAINSAKTYKPTQNSGYSQAYNTYLQNQVNAAKGKPEYAYREQFSCLQQKAAQEFARTGKAGWAGGFIKHLFDYIASQNPCEGSMQKVCSSPIQIFCMNKIGEFHFKEELAPGFASYAAATNKSNNQRWTADHEAFFTNAVTPCLDDLYGDSNFTFGLCFPSPSGCLAQSISKHVAKCLIIDGARRMREEAQSYTQESIFKSRNGLGKSLRSAAIAFPSPPQKQDLFSTDIEVKSSLKITADTLYWLKPGMSIQLSVRHVDSLGHTTDLTRATTGTVFQLNVDSNVATISPNGLLLIKSTSYPLINDRLTLHVYAQNGSWEGVGQFAIYDTDQDGDNITDTYEQKNGLNPFSPNGMTSDLDGDDLLDIFEVFCGSNPLSKDTDGDGFTDKVELLQNTNPMNANSYPSYIESVADGAWNSPQSWSCYCVPSSTDNVRIKSNHVITVNIDSAAARSLYVEGKINYNLEAKIKLSQP